MDVPELTAVMFAKPASVRRRVENPRRNHTALLGFRVVQGPGTIDIVGLGPWIRGHMREQCRSEDYVMALIIYWRRSQFHGKMREVRSPMVHC